MNPSNLVMFAGYCRPEVSEWIVEQLEGQSGFAVWDIDSIAIYRKGGIFLTRLPEDEDQYTLQSIAYAVAQEGGYKVKLVKGAKEYFRAEWSL